MKFNNKDEINYIVEQFSTMCNSTPIYKCESCKYRFYDKDNQTIIQDRLKCFCNYLNTLEDTLC